MLTEILDELEDDGKSIDVVCITEHNMTSDDTHLVDLPNYHVANCFTRNKRNGGTCILVKNSLKYTVLDFVAGYSVQNVVECCAIKMTEHEIIVICLYRIPKNNKNTYDIFFNILMDILDNLAYDNKIIVCGDFNINILTKSQQCTEFKQIILGYDMKFAIEKPTRLDSGTCIDNMIHNIRGCKSEILEFALSDHTAQVLECPVKKFCTLHTWYTLKRDYSKENMIKFGSCINSLSFKDMYECESSNEAFNIFYDNFKLFYDLCFPIIRIRHTTKQRPTWLSKGIRLCSKRKRELLWKYRLDRTKYNKTIFKVYKNRLNKIIKLTQKCQNNHFINTAVNKSKASWKIINKSKLNFPKETISQIKHENKIIRDPTEIAKAFNNYFTNLPVNFTQTNNKFTCSYYNPHSMFMRPTIPQDIFKIINDLKNTNSTGYDDINTKVIKFVSAIIAPILSFLINLSITEGVFPSKLKITVIKPLFKKNNREDMKYYRPIALIPIFSKIYEKVIHNNIYQYLESNDILATEQKGFRKGKNINMAIFDMLYTVHARMDKRLPIFALFIDLTKAFDYVDHGILLKKLERYGIRGNMNNLINSYLSGRSQITYVSKICQQSKTETIYTSGLSTVQQGVPQGSVLGPLLFITYLNDIVNSTKNKMILFADDCTVLFHNKSDISNGISDITDWLQNNNLQLNLDKTKIINFRQRKKETINNITNNGKAIEESLETKFLGLYLDYNMSWNTHIGSICSRLSKCSYLLHKLNKIVNRDTVLVAYHGLVASILRYGIIFWGNATGSNMVFKSQKRCIRAICNLQRTDSCKQYFKRLNILTVPSLYIYEVCLYVRTNLHLFRRFESTRRCNKLRAHPCKTALFHKSVFAMAPQVYNSLPDAICNITELNSFKHNLHQFLAEKAFYTLKEFLEPQ